MLRGITIIGAVLVASLAVNLFLAGNMLGMQFHRRVPLDLFNQRLNMIWQRMPEADQPIARGIVERHHDEILEKWRALRDSSLRAGLALHAEQFEDEDAKAAVAKWNQRYQDYRTALHDTLLEAASKVSPEGRARIPVNGF